LWRNPVTSAEALAVADAILQDGAAEIGKAGKPEHGVTTLLIGDRKYGESVSIALSDLQSTPWIGCAFAQTDLVRAAWYLRRGSPLFPGSRDLFPVGIVRLGDIATLGPDRRDII
jgi:hypothetical protein